MNGEHIPKTNTEKPLSTAEEQEWQSLRGRLEDRPPTEYKPSPDASVDTLKSEESPVDVIENKDFVEPGQVEANSTPGFAKEGQIEARLSPTPLSEEKKQELVVKSLSDSAKDVAEYGEARAAMTPEQRRELDNHHEYAALLKTKDTNPEAFTQGIASLSPERHAEYDAYVKSEEKAQRERVLEQASKLEGENDFLILHSLKFSDPARFEEIFKGLSPEQKGHFDSFEISEDSRMKINNPEMAIPKLSVMGDKWELSGNLPVDRQTPEQMQADAADAFAHETELAKSVKAEEKPKGWAKVKSWFSKKPKK